MAQDIFALKSAAGIIFTKENFIVWRPLLKSLFWISLVLATLLPLTWFCFILFLCGGFVFPFITPILSTICVFILISVVITFPFLLLANFVKAIYQWKNCGGRLLLPIMIMILGFLLTIPLLSIAHKLRDMRFHKYLPQYEQVAAEIENSAPYDFNQVSPAGWTHLSLAPLNTYRENDGSLTIEFLVGAVGPPPRHRLYIYRSNGIIEDGSQTSKRWRWSTRVNEHWFKAGD